MVDQLQPLGTLSEQHASEMEALERRARREPLWGGGPSSTAPDMLLRLALSGAPLLTCLRRLLLTVAMRGALPDAAFMECVRILLDAFGAHHVLTITALEAAGTLPAANCLAALHFLSLERLHQPLSCSEVSGGDPAACLSKQQLCFSLQDQRHRTLLKLYDVIMSVTHNAGHFTSCVGRGSLQIGHPGSDVACGVPQCT